MNAASTPGGARILSPAEADLLRRALAAAPGADLSPGGLWSAEVAGDSVVLTESGTGARKTLATPGYSPKEVAVSDDGRAAFLAPAADGQGQVLARVEPDGTVREVARSFGMSSPELSSDGGRLTWLSLYDVKEAGPGGERVAARTPYIADRTEFLPDGRLMVECDRDGWGTGFRVPHYWLVQDGRPLQTLESVEEAEGLGRAVRPHLVEAQRAIFPGATVAQGEDLVDRFGFRTPNYRALSPSRARSVFWVEGHGLQVLEAGVGPSRAALTEGDARQVGRGQVFGSEWAPGERHVAVTFEGGPSLPRAVVVDFQGGSRVLRGAVHRTGSRAPLWWSPDGRWLAVEMREGERTAVHLYDTREDAQFPLLAEGTVVGWRAGRLEVEVDGRRRLVDPGPLDLEKGREYLLGPRPEDAGSIEVGEDGVRVGDVHLPRR